MTEYELYHYGVIGMKWGHHTSKNYNKTTKKDSINTSETENQNKKSSVLNKRNLAIGLSVVAATATVIGATYVYKKRNIPIAGIKSVNFGTIINPSSLSNKDTVLKNGTKLRRVSSKKVEDYTKEGNHIYVSHLKKDNRYYKEEMPKLIKKWAKTKIVDDDGKKSYEHVIKTKGTIRVPSKKFMAEAYMKATGSSKVDAGRYSEFMEQLVDRKNPQVISFFKYIRDNGYNAIIDENDAGVTTKSPLILLDPDKNIKSVKSHRINSLEKFMNVVLM